MTAAELPPALLMLAAAPLMALPRGPALRAVALLVPALALAQSAWLLSGDARWEVQFLGFVLTPIRASPAGGLFAIVFCVMAAGGLQFAAGRAARAELCAGACYAAGALGVCFAGDMLSLLVWWEVMMLAATVIIWCGGARARRGAGLRYFCMHALGGVLMMAGIALIAAARIHAGEPQPLELRPMRGLIQPWPGLSPMTAGVLLVLLALLVYAGAPPFSAWLADAYPEASGTGAVFLSAFTTKAAVLCLMVCFAGLELLVWVGVWMALYGIVYAVLENDIRRVLAYSIVNQVGFMLVGVGVGTPLALDGASAHAVAHILYKALLFMTAAAVVAGTGTRLLSEMGGLWRAMPVTAACCIVGAMSISAFPFTSGFTTKGMIDEALARHAASLAAADLPAGHMLAAWVALEIAAAGVFLHAGIKLPWFVFFGRESGARPQEPSRPMRAVMILFAALCIGLGLYPAPLYALLPYQAEAWAYEKVVYSAAHVAQMLGLLAFAGLAFFVQLPLLRPRRMLALDFDWFWRRFPGLFWRELAAPIVRRGRAAIRRAARRLRARLSKFPRGVLRLAPEALILSLLALYLALFLLRS